MSGSLNETFYFGCWSEPGHFLFDTSGRTVYEGSLPSDFPVRIHVLDGGLLGSGRNRSEAEGRAVLSHIAEWTVLSFWDRSVDERGGCNSNFVMRGRLDFLRAVEVAKEKFPSIWSRFKFDVVPAHN